MNHMLCYAISNLYVWIRKACVILVIHISSQYISYNAVTGECLWIDFTIFKASLKESVVHIQLTFLKTINFE